MRLTVPIQSFYQSKETLQQEIAQLSSSTSFAEVRLEATKASAFVITIKLGTPRSSLCVVCSPSRYVASRVYIPALTVTMSLDANSGPASGGDGLSFHFGPEFEACEFFQTVRKNFEEHLRHAPHGPYSLGLLAETFATAAADVQS